METEHSPASCRNERNERSRRNVDVTTRNEHSVAATRRNALLRGSVPTPKLHESSRRRLMLALLLALARTLLLALARRRLMLALLLALARRLLLALTRRRLMRALARRRLLLALTRPHEQSSCGSASSRLTWKGLTSM